MPIAVYIILIIVASLVLIKAVSLFIESSTKIAHHMGISEYTISFLIVAIATSLPEMVVGITSALEKNPILSYGNAIGSNIALLTLIAAVPILLSTGISTRTLLHSRDAYTATLFAFMPIMFSIDGAITRTDGAILVSAYIIYFYLSLRRGTIVEQIMDRLEGINMWKQAVIFVFSLLLLLTSSELIVRSAITISTYFKLSLGFIGLSITAMGTSLPELAYTIESAKKIQTQSIMGDIVGSIVANSTAVIGVTALVHPILISDSKAGISALVFLVFTMLVFLRFARTREKIDKKEALILLFIYFAFLFLEFNLQRGININSLFEF